MILMVAACAGPSESRAPTESASPPASFNGEWETCPDKPGWDCNTIAVPWDYRDQRRYGDIELQVVRHPAGKPKDRLGALLWNPGGPGAAAIDDIDESLFSRGILDHFDIVTFTPRGTAVSGLACPDGTGSFISERDGLLPSLLDRADTERWYATIAEFNRACALAMGDKATLIGTWQTAADMDVIRRALGEERVSFLGYSYGGRLGQVYAHRFGAHLRALVMDSPGETQGDIGQYAQGKGEAFANRFRALDLLCGYQAKRRWCGLGGEPTSVYAETLVRLIDGDLSITPAVTPDKFTMLMIDAMPDTQPETMKEAAAALRAATRGSAGPLIRLVEGDDDDSLDQTVEPDASGTESGPASDYREDDALVAINCADSATRPDLQAIMRTTETIAAEHPDSALYAGSLAGLCVNWPLGSDPIGPATADLEAQVLIVKAKGDPQTAPGAANLNATAFEKPVVLTWNGFKHGVTGTGAAPCVDDAVTAYLLDPAAPIEADACTR